MSYAGSEEIGKIREGTGYIKRIYHGSTMVFKYTNPVIYHIDDSTSIPKVTRNVEYGVSCRTAYTAGTPSGWGSEWEFVGWRTDKTASGTVLTSSNDKIMGHEAVNLYAVFKKVFTLSYAAGGGTGSMDAQTITQYYNNGNYSTGDTNGATFTLKVNGFSRTNYTFNGWSINGSTKNAGDTIKLSGDATATALWKQNTYTTTAVNVLTYGDGTDILPSEFKAESTHVLIAQNVDLSSYTKMQIYALKFVSDHEVMENNKDHGTDLRVYLKNANTSTNVMTITRNIEDNLHGESDDHWEFIGTSDNGGLVNISSYNGIYSIYCCTYMANGQCEVLGVKFTFS